MENSNGYTELETNQEKPYYEQNTTPQIQAKTSENESKKKCNLYSVCEKISECLSDFKYRFNSNEELLLKTFLQLLIQFIIIFLFTFLGFIFDINKAFIKGEGAIWGTFIPTTILILIMCYSSLCCKDSALLYIYIILYIPCIIFYCFLLSDYTNYINIICGLTLFILDIISFIVIIVIFSKIHYIAFLILSAIITIITLLIFHFKWIGNGLTTFKISTVGLSEIIYLAIVTFVTIEKFEIENYVFETIVFDLAIFSPLAIVVLITIIYWIIQIASIFDDKKKKKY